MNETGKNLAKALGIAFGLACVMIACGFVTLVVSVVYLMALGSKLHGNYEYFGDYPHLYLGPAAIGFFAPALAVLIGAFAVRIWRRSSANRLGGNPFRAPTPLR